jgi:hypothetical protein
MRHLHELKETGEFRLSTHKHYASLGSGLGMDCFTAAEYREPETGLQFSTITGFEFDQRLCAEARGIAQEFGFENVTFINEDFIRSPHADPSLFDVIYFYRPFVDNFIPLMAERLRKTSPGTIVISRLFTFPSVFSSEFFRQIYPPESRYPMDTVSLDFFSYLRK